jgi:dihydropteroate synthase
MQTFTLRWRNFALELGRRTAIMGIVNITPDSFSDGGRFFSHEAALAQAERLVKAGADIIDIGGESTRPFAEDVAQEDEMRRVLPVIEGLASRIAVPISIDTTKAAVAEAALASGASMINDISAMSMDPRMAEVAARHKVPVILMHMKGIPRTMQVEPVYQDLMGEICGYLELAMERAQDAGIARQNIIVDPGIGFGKTSLHNLQVIRNLGQLAALGAPILIGPSRKAFIRKLVAEPPQKELSADRPEVETGTQAALAMAIMNGAHIVRVHNVANTKAMVKVLDAIRWA